MKLVVLTMVHMKIIAFRHVTQCSLVDRQCSRETCCFHLQGTYCEDGGSTYCQNISNTAYFQCQYPTESISTVNHHKSFKSLSDMAISPGRNTFMCCQKQNSVWVSDPTSLVSYSKTDPNVPPTCTHVWRQEHVPHFHVGLCLHFVFYFMVSVPQT